MGDNVHSTVTAVSMENFALYIEGQRCPFTTIQRHRGSRGDLPNLTVMIPAVELTLADDRIFSPKDIKPRAKVVLLMRDPTPGITPAMVVLFEGELTNPGFVRTPDQKNYQFMVRHVLSNLDGLTLTALDPASYLEEEISGRTAENDNLAPVLSGTIFEKLSPKEIAAKTGKQPMTALDIYDFVKGSLQVFLAEAQNSVTKEAWPIKATVAYGLADRLFSKDKDTTVHMKWDTIYYLIMQYTFIELLPKVGGSRVSYLQMINLMSQLFLHDVTIAADPPDYHNSLVLKPDNVFQPPPECNIIFPIMLTSLPYFEPWDQKPTRLTQITQPSTGLNSKILREFMRTVSPPVLRDKFKAYQLDKTKPADLTTDEEKIRGIVESYNEVPAFLSAAISLIYNNDPSTNTGTTGNTYAIGAASNTGGTTPTTTSIGITEDFIVDKTAYEKVFAKKAMHEYLMNIETYTNWDATTPGEGKDYKTGGAKAINPSLPKMRPLRIYIIKDSFKIAEKKSNYIISTEGGVATLKVNKGRYFHIFQEAHHVLPLAVRFNIDKIAYGAIRFKESPFITPLMKTEFPEIGTKALANKIGEPNADLTATYALEQGCISGYSHTAIAIYMDAQPQSVELAGKLVAIITEMCEMKLATGQGGAIKAVYDELGDKIPAGGKIEPAYEEMVNKVVAKAVEFKPKLIEETTRRFDAAFAKKEAKPVVDLTKITKNAEKLTPKPPPVTNQTNYAIERSVRLKPGVEPEEIAKKSIEVLKKSDKHSSPDTAIDDIPGQYGAFSERTQLSIDRVLKLLLDTKPYIKTTYHDIRAMLCYLLTRSNGNSLITTSDAAYMDILGKYEKVLVSFRKKIDASIAKGGVMRSFFSFDKNDAMRPHVNFVVLLGMLVGALQLSDKPLDTILKIVADSLKEDPENLSKMIVKLRDTFGGDGSTIIPLFTLFVEYYDNLYKPAAEAKKATEAAKKEKLSTLTDLADFLGTTLPHNAFITGGKDPEAKSDTEEAKAKAEPNETIEKRKLRYADLNARYIEPICDYTFYKLRYESSTVTLQSEFNPYIAPGYSGMILDTLERGFRPTHLRCFIISADDVITPESVTTQITCGYVRRADESSLDEMVYHTGKVDKAGNPIALGAIDAVESIPMTDGVAGSGKSGVPFFTGEWGNDWDNVKNVWQLDKTYQKVLGCNMWEQAKQNTDEIVGFTISEIPDYTKALKHNYRKIQSIQFTNVPSSVKAVYGAYYKASPSLVFAPWNNFDFPETIDMATGNAEATKPADLAKEKAKNVEDRSKIVWDKYVANYIQKVRLTVRSRTASQG